MPLNHRRFVDWVERRMLSAAGSPSRFELCHVNKAGGYAVVCKLEPMEGAGADDIAETLAEQVAAEAMDHVDAWPGRQQYVVKAYTKEEHDAGEFAFYETANAVTNSRASEMLIDMTPEQHALAGGHLPQPEMLGHPTAMVASQQMRHTEALVRSIVDMSTRQSERDTQIIRQQQSAIDKHDGRYIQMLELVEDMHSRQAERELEAKKYDDDNNRKERLLSNLTKYVLPAIGLKAGALVGGKGKPAAGDDDDAKTVAKIRAIFLNLPKETQDKVLADCTEEQKDTLLDAFVAAGEEAASSAETKH